MDATEKQSDQVEADVPMKSSMMMECSQSDILNTETRTENIELEECIVDVNASGKKITETVDFINLTPDSKLKSDISKSSGHLFVREGEEESTMDQDEMEFDKYNYDIDNKSLNLTEKISKSEDTNNSTSVMEFKEFSNCSKAGVDLGILEADTAKSATPIESSNVEGVQDSEKCSPDSEHKQDTVLKQTESSCIEKIDCINEVKNETSVSTSELKIDSAFGDTNIVNETSSDKVEKEAFISESEKNSLVLIEVEKETSVGGNDADVEISVGDSEVVEKLIPNCDSMDKQEIFVGDSNVKAKTFVINSEVEKKSSFSDSDIEMVTTPGENVVKEKSGGEANIGKETLLVSSGVTKKTCVSHTNNKIGTSIDDKKESDIKMETSVQDRIIQEKSSVATKKVKQGTCSRESNVNAGGVGKRQLESNNEVFVKNVCVAGSDNLTKKAKKIKQMVGTQCKVVEFEGNASCSKKKTSCKKRKSTLEFGNQSIGDSAKALKDNDISSRKLAENLVECVDSVREKEAPKEEKKTDAEKGRRTLSFIRNFKRNITKMTRGDLEEFVLQKIGEAIAYSSEVGELRRKCNELEELLKLWKDKALVLHRQVKDMNFVMRKLGAEIKAGKKDAVPMKITRSVSLQVGPSSSAVSVTYKPRIPKDGDPSVPAAAKGLKKEVPKGIFPTPSTSGPTPAKTSVPKSTVKTLQPMVRDTSIPKFPPGVSGYPISSAPTTPKLPQAKPLVPPVSSVPSTTASKGFLKPLAPPPLPTNTRLKPSDLKIIDLTDEEGKRKKSMYPATSATSTTSTASNASNLNVTPASRVMSPANNATKDASVRNVASTSNATVAGKPVRFVHSSGASLLSPTGAGVTYLLPTTSVPMQPVQPGKHVHQIGQLHQISQVQQGRQGQVIITGSPAIRPVGVQSTALTVMPVAQVPGNPRSLFRRPANTSIHIGAPQPSQQIRLGTSVQRMPSRISLPAAAPAPAAVSFPSTAAASTVVPARAQSVAIHPAPLPPTPPAPRNVSNKLSPPKPDLKISRVTNKNQQGIVLSWNMKVTTDYEEIASYQLYAYQETASSPSTTLWMKVGDVKSLALPMACTLTQFVAGHKYHFAVRAIDVYARYGPFSSPEHIVL